MTKVFVLLTVLSGVCGFAQGTVSFQNLRGDTNGLIVLNAPVYLSDGLTKASGPQFMAGLMAGPRADELSLITTTPFLTGAAAGYFSGSQISIPGVPPGGTAFIQVVAWNSSRYGTPFDAQASGLWDVFGASRPFQVVTSDSSMMPPQIPALLTGLKSFTLVGYESALPPLLHFSYAQNSAVLCWAFTGAYFWVEQCSDLKVNNWVTLSTIVPNFVGTKYQVTLPAPTQTTFYRLKERPIL